MPRGDKAKMWWPEVVDHLKSTFDPNRELTWKDLANYRDTLETIIDKTRAKHGLGPVVFHCPQCHEAGRGSLQEITLTVSAVIFALGRFDLIPKQKSDDLRKSWARYRKKFGLDEKGYPIQSAGR